MPLTVAQLVARLTADTSGFYRGMAIANSAMLRSGGIITRVAAGAGLATLGMGIMSLRAAGNFEQSMNILGAVSEANTKQMGSMRKEAVALGADMKLPNVSAKDAADAMQELAKGGLSVSNILKATRGTLQLGLAANIGFADSAVIVARALQAFHLEGTQATKVADLFSAAANKSTADMGDIALGFQAASAQFAAGDQTIQGLTTSLALMANAGIVGSDAGTSLKTMMNRLMAPTKKSADLMADLGFKVYDSSGNMKAMPTLIGDLNSSLKGMSKEQKNAALYTIFGSDAIRAARVQLNAGEKGWTKMEASITKGGEAQKLAEARTKGFNGALQAFGSVAETLAINLGTALLPAATALVRTFTSWMAAINPDAIIAFFAAITGGVSAIYNFIAGSDLLVATLAGLAAAIVAYKTIVTTISVVTRAWAAAQVLLNAAMAMNPFVLIIAALVGLGVALYVAYQKSEQFRNIVNGVFSWLKAYVPPIVQAVANAVSSAFNAIKSTVTSILSAVQSVVTTVWNAIRSVSQTVWTAISSTVMSVVNNLRSAITAAFNIYRSIISAAWNVISAITTSAWNIIRTIVTSVIDVIRGKISAMTAFRNIVTAVWNGIKAVTTAAWNGIKQVVTTAVANIPTIISGIAGAAAAAALGVGKAIINGILNGVSGLGGMLKDKISGMIGGALSSIDIPGFSPPGHAGETIGKRISDGMVRGILLGGVDMPAKLSEKLKTALEAGKAQVDAYQSAFKEAFGNLANDAFSAFDAQTSAHLTKSESILKKLEMAELNARLRKNLTDAKETLAKHLQEMRDLEGELSQKQGQLTAMRNAPADEQDPNKILDMEQSIRDMNQKHHELGLQSRDDLLAIEAAKLEIRKQKLAEAAARERLEYAASRDLQKRHLESQLAGYEEQMAKHPERAQFWQNKILATLRANGVTYRAAGTLLGKSFAVGMRESVDEVEAAAKAIAATVARYLKLHSPAAEGPLSDLNTWWKALGSTIVQGVNVSPVERASAALAGAMGPSAWAPAYAGVSAPATRSSGAVTQQFITVEGSVIKESELFDYIRDGLQRDAGRGRTLSGTP